ncbi:MAG: hypothetical protein ACTSWY_09645 [Promethearchaeota archaeon]
MTKKKKHGTRTKIHNELNNYNMDVDTRKSIYKPKKLEKIRTKNVETKKLNRDIKKLKKSHIKNRRNLKSRWKENEFMESFN